MSNSLIRKPATGTGLLFSSEARRAMDAALAKLRTEPRLPAPASRIIAPSSQAYALVVGQAVDVPRFCAVHDKGYVSRYILMADLHYRYAQSIRMVEALHDQYQSILTVEGTVPSGDCADETCPWCGAKGFGALHCGTCHTMVCHGRTVGRQFRCRPSCNHSGFLKTVPRDYEGLKPALDGPSMRST